VGYARGTKRHRGTKPENRKGEIAKEKKKTEHYKAPTSQKRPKNRQIRGKKSGGTHLKRRKCVTRGENEICVKGATGIQKEVDR